MLRLTQSLLRDMRSFRDGNTRPTKATELFD